MEVKIVIREWKGLFGVFDHQLFNRVRHFYFELGREGTVTGMRIDFQNGNDI